MAETIPGKIIGLITEINKREILSLVLAEPVQYDQSEMQLVFLANPEEMSLDKGVELLGQASARWDPVLAKIVRLTKVYDANGDFNCQCAIAEGENLKDLVANIEDVFVENGVPVLDNQLTFHIPLSLSEDNSAIDNGIIGKIFSIEKIALVLGPDIESARLGSSKEDDLFAIVEDHPACNGFGVVRSSDNVLMGCYDNSIEAREKLEELLKGAGEDADEILVNLEIDTKETFMPIEDLLKAALDGLQPNPGSEYTEEDRLALLELLKSTSFGGPEPDWPAIEAIEDLIDKLQKTWNKNLQPPLTDQTDPTVSPKVYEILNSSDVSELAIGDMPDDTPDDTPDDMLDPGQFPVEAPVSSTITPDQLVIMGAMAQKSRLMSRGPDFRGIIIPMGIKTGDKRIIERGALKCRETPLPLMYLPANLGGGHQGSIMAGVWIRMWIEEYEDFDAIWGEGVFDLGGSAGQEAARVLDEGMMRGISADLDDVTIAEIGQGEDYVMALVSGRVMGASFLSMPAFQEASMWRVHDQEDKEESIMVASGSELYRPSLSIVTELNFSKVEN